MNTRSMAFMGAFGAGVVFIGTALVAMVTKASVALPHVRRTAIWRSQPLKNQIAFELGFCGEGIEGSGGILIDFPTACQEF